MKDDFTREQPIPVDFQVTPYGREARPPDPDALEKQEIGYLGTALWQLGGVPRDSRRRRCRQGGGSVHLAGGPASGVSSQDRPAIG